MKELILQSFHSDRGITVASESRHAPPPQHSWPGGDVQDMGPGPHRDSRWMSSELHSNLAG